MLEDQMERIADALERIAAAQEEFLTFAEWNKERLSGRTKAAESQAETAPVESAPSPSYEELKAKLIAAGIEVKKGTKMTTLLKLAENLKGEAPVNEASVTEPEEGVEEPPQVEETESGAQIDEAAAAPDAPKPMTALEAREAIMALGYTGAPEQRDAMKQALAAVGKAKFTELAEGEYEGVIAAYKKGMGLA